MSDLLETQKEFQNAVLANELKAPVFFVATEKVSAEERLEIYSDAYRLRLIEVLESNYPVLSRYLGEEDFSNLALGYLEYYPSEYRNVRWYGDRLSEFMAETELYGENAFLIELAKLEWIFSLVFDASDSGILAFSDLSNIPPEKWPNLILKIHPSVHRLDLHWNSAEIWEALMHEAEEYPEPNQFASPEHWIFWRKDFEISFSLMDPREALIFDLAAESKTWQELCEALLPFMSEEEIPNYIAPLLGKWLQAGLISSFLSFP